MSIVVKNKSIKDLKKVSCEIIKKKLFFTSSNNLTFSFSLRSMAKLRWLNSSNKEEATELLF